MMPGRDLPRSRSAMHVRLQKRDGSGNFSVSAPDAAASADAEAGRTRRTGTRTRKQGGSDPTHHIMYERTTNQPTNHDGHSTRLSNEWTQKQGGGGGRGRGSRTEAEATQPITSTTLHERTTHEPPTNEPSWPLNKINERLSMNQFLNVNATTKFDQCTTAM